MPEGTFCTHTGDGRPAVSAPWGLVAVTTTAKSPAGGLKCGDCEMRAELTYHNIIITNAFLRTIIYKFINQSEMKVIIVKKSLMHFGIILRFIDLDLVHLKIKNLIHPQKIRKSGKVKKTFIPVKSNLQSKLCHNITPRDHKKVVLSQRWSFGTGSVTLKITYWDLMSHWSPRRVASHHSFVCSLRGTSILLTFP